MASFVGFFLFSFSFCYHSWACCLVLWLIDGLAGSLGDYFSGHWVSSKCWFLMLSVGSDFYFVLDGFRDLGNQVDGLPNLYSVSIVLDVLMDCYWLLSMFYGIQVTVTGLFVVLAGLEWAWNASYLLPLLDCWNGSMGSSDLPLFNILYNQYGYFANVTIFLSFVSLVSESSHNFVSGFVMLGTHLHWTGENLDTSSMSFYFIILPFYALSLMQVTYQLGLLKSGIFWRWRSSQALFLEATNFVSFWVPLLLHHSMFLGFYVFLPSSNLELVGVFCFLIFVALLSSSELESPLSTL